MIVQYRADIRQPEKTGGLRKIEIASTRLTLQCSKRGPAKPVEYCGMRGELKNSLFNQWFV
ncbi:hypothetical protein [Burkholderia sp. AU45388]|uniref:hypothetical protein n=1 Tax=Burkholderia sp. AU45388 TaxID=3059206 RepID=UPI00264E3621|nr:hypothetical protein [Burkholderia sp. AU45388]MDN7426857.1 hypothetical protein [Burkholderia sp. AU45388]